MSCEEKTEKGLFSFLPRFLKILFLPKKLNLQQCRFFRAPAMEWMKGGSAEEKKNFSSLVTRQAKNVSSPAQSKKSD